MEKPDAWLTTPSAVLIGALIISSSILVSGGVIKFKGLNQTTTANATPAQTAQPSPQAQQVASLAQVKDAFDKSQLKFGESNKKVVVVEVADPSCPYCHIAAGKNPELNKQVGPRFTLVADGGSYIAPVPEFEKLARDGKIAFAYIYYPGHGSGEMGAKAFYCANEKGKFWEVHDLLMSGAGYSLMNDKVKNDKGQSQALADFLQPAFDPSAMKSCLESGKYDSRLKDDMALATSLNITGTPGFYVNATPYLGAYSYSDMEPTIKSALGN